MYKNSTDRRFIKNKREFRRAYIDLTIQKGYRNFSIAELAWQAELNRMTFYKHYDNLDDVFQEFIDDMIGEIERQLAAKESADLADLFHVSSQLMYQEIDFFRYVAKAGNCADFREAFKNSFQELLKPDLQNGPSSKTEALIRSDLYSATIATAYLDWLAGIYGKAGLDEVLKVTEQVLKEQIQNFEASRP